MSETESGKKPKVVAIIQARMGSTRLPGKVTMEIAGKPMLQRVIERVQRAKTVDQVIVAVPESDDTVGMSTLCPVGVHLCYGSEHDVLERYDQAARENNADIIVRITSDCPLIDPDVIDEVVGKFLQYSPDYASNTMERSYPRGLDVEVFSRAALERAAKEAGPGDREHVTPYMLRHPEFRRLPVTGGTTDGTVNWSVDTQEDLDRVREIYAYFHDQGRDDFTWIEAIHHCAAVALAANSAFPTLMTQPTDTPRPTPEIVSSEPPRRSKVAVIGTAPSTRDLAPYTDDSWEIWSLSNRVVTDQIPRWDRHFELHPLSQFERDPEARPYIDWMHRQEGKPIFLQSPRQYPGIKCGVQFPYAPLIAKFGRYFTSTIAWQIALAIHEGAEEIGLWGVDLMLHEEYVHQRPCVEFLLGWASGRGIRVTVPRQSSLLKPQQLYGMEGECGARQAIIEHKARLSGMVQQFQMQRDQAALKMAHTQGAVEGLTFAEQMSG